MSGYSKSSGTRRAKNSAAILIAALVVFSAIAIAQSNVLQWPLSAELHSLEGNRNSGATNSTSNTNSDSSIFVWARAYVPVLKTQNSSQVFGEIPIIGASIKLFENASVTHANPSSLQGRLNVKGVLIRSNSTDTAGQIHFLVPSGLYLVSMTSEFGNFSVTVPAEVRNTTELDILVNDSSYTSSYFEIENQASPGLLLPWESIYLKIDSNTLPKVSANESVYLGFSFANTTSGSPIGTNCTICFLNSTIFPPQIRAQLISVFSSPSQGTMWLQLQTNSNYNVTNISGVSVYVSFINYSVRQYPMNNQTNANITSSIITGTA